MLESTCVIASVLGYAWWMHRNDVKEHEKYEDKERRIKERRARMRANRGRRSTDRV